MKETIDQMREAVINSPGQEGVLQGLVAIIQNVPDSQLVADGFEGIDPHSYENPDLKSKISALLSEAGHNDMADKWISKTINPLPDNVVRFGETISNADNSELIGVQISKADQIGFNDVGGLESVKKQIRRRIIDPFLKKEIFARFKRRAGGGVLMYGPPGCGKTMLARALAHECNADFFNVKASDILEQYIGAAEKNIVDIFQKARENKPVVLFFDEIEALAQKRQFGDSHKINTSVSTLLTEMDGFESDNDGVLIVGATNVPWSLDSAFRRPGRFDRTIFVPPPDKVARKFILNHQLKDRPVSAHLDVKSLVARTSGFSGADLVGLVDTAIDYAIDDTHSATDLVELSSKHFTEALNEVRSSTGEWLSQARGYVEHANKDGLYDDLATFLKKYARRR